MLETIRDQFNSAALSGMLMPFTKEFLDQRLEQIRAGVPKSEVRVSQPMERQIIGNYFGMPVRIRIIIDDPEC